MVYTCQDAVLPVAEMSASLYDRGKELDVQGVLDLISTTQAKKASAAEKKNGARAPP